MFIQRIIDWLRQTIHLLKSARSRSSERPGNINIQRKLYINSPIADSRPCTREQATRFYNTLSGFQQHIEELSSVEDEEQLADWFAGFNDWTENSWRAVDAYPCDGTALFTRALRAVAMWAVLSRITGIKGEIPADVTMELLANLAGVDLSAMDQDISPYVWLQVNRIVRDVPLCSEARTETFYATVDKLEEQKHALLAVDCYESLQDWVFDFHEWRENTWGEFYDNPCGLVLEQIYYLESRIYLAACMQYNEYASGAANVLNKAIDEWRSQAARDLAIISGTGSAKTKEN